MVDRNGVLNVVSLDLGKGWEGPDTLGNASLVPGSPIAVFNPSPTVCTALMVDRNGVLNFASLDLGKGWEGPDTLGNARLLAGARIELL